MLIAPSSTWDLKWWYPRAMCFVLGVKIGAFAILTQLLSSSNNFHFVIGPRLQRFNFEEIYFSRLIIVMTSLRHIDNSECSDSVDDRVILACNLICQVIGKPKTWMMCPVRENILSIVSASILFYPFAKSESANATNPLLINGCFDSCMLRSN